jgi:16S rRNA (cytosine1402-N4)-methyltransferase
MKYHEPVLVDEVIQALKVRDGGRYVDATLGDGGHTIEILKKGGIVLGIDCEDGSLERAKQRIKEADLEKNFTAVRGNFIDVENLARENEFFAVDGILYDLGYSSSQLEDNLGLAFSKEQPLDMRLDKTLGVKALDLINVLTEKELTRIFKEFGEEPHAKKYAQDIVEARKVKKLTTTTELADLISGSAPSHYEKLHPATRVFQALRIAINNEIDNLTYSLPRAARLLLPGGRMAVISFHSLEDRIVKQFGLGVQPDLKAVSDGIITPSEEEVAANPRARSAKMRVFEKANTSGEQGKDSIIVLKG